MENYENQNYWPRSVYERMMKEEEKEMKNETGKFWMITGDGNQPKVRHTSFASAEAEANRLAKTYPGVEFYVLEATVLITQPSGVIRKKL